MPTITKWFTHTENEICRRNSLQGCYLRRRLGRTLLDLMLNLQLLRVASSHQGRLVLHQIWNIRRQRILDLCKFLSVGATRSVHLMCGNGINYHLLLEIQDLQISFLTLNIVAGFYKNLEYFFDYANLSLVLLTCRLEKLKAIKI